MKDIFIILILIFVLVPLIIYGKKTDDKINKDRESYVNSLKDLVDYLRLIEKRFIRIDK